MTILKERRTCVGSLFDQVRSIIRDSGESRYSIAKATGISQSQLSSFMAGTKGLGSDAMDTLLLHLGFEIQLKKIKKNK